MRENIKANVAVANAKKKDAWLPGYRLAQAQAKAQKARRVAEAEEWIRSVRARRKTPA